MKEYKVTGMSCAACSTRVEKVVSKLDGVSSCSVNLLTNSMTVEGTATDEEIIKAVEDAGYRAFKKGNERVKNDSVSGDDVSNELKNRFFYSLIFLVILMYFSMGYMMWGFPVPEFFDGNHVALAILQLLLSILIIFINKKFFVNGFKGLLKKAPNMDTLVALGSGASFLYSLFALFLMTDAQLNGNHAAVMGYMDELYFESAAMILVLITLGKMLEERAKGKTTNALKSLMDLTPKTAIIEVDGKEREVPIENIKKGDIFLVKPGASIPADGVIIDGYCSVNESALTGESIPVDKKEGDFVSQATVNKSGFVRCEATKVGEDTTLSQIIKLVSDAAATKAPIAKVADKVSGIFVPLVIVIAIVTITVWLGVGESFGFALARGISVLVISCPCALGLATPVAIMVGNGVGAKGGILFKNAIALEETGKVKIVALDKTGTITSGEPQVTDVITNGNLSRDELIKFAYSLEAKSEHPLAKAIVKKAEELNIKAIESYDFKAIEGNGLTAVIDDRKVFGGNLKFASEKCTLSQDVVDIYKKLADEGKTPLFFGADNELMGIIAVADAIKEDSVEAIAELKKMGIRVVMLTGDNEKTARAVQKLSNIDEVIADVMPAGKEETVRELKQKGRVAMVGDGINDAPALTSADVGIAIGSGTDIAIDAADVVLVNNSLKDVVSAIKLSRKTLKNIHENLFWAFIYNILGIPLAAGVLISLLGLKLTPMFGAAAMSLSSVCVVSNALRLNLIKLKNKEKEAKGMEKIIKIEGMMCMHCEARVKKLLESVDGVDEVIVSHEKGNAILKLSKEISDEFLKELIENEGYKFIG